MNCIIVYIQTISSSVQPLRKYDSFKNRLYREAVDYVLFNFEQIHLETRVQTTGSSHRPLTTLMPWS